MHTRVGSPCYQFETATSYCIIDVAPLGWGIRDVRTYVYRASHGLWEFHSFLILWQEGNMDSDSDWIYKYKIAVILLARWVYMYIYRARHRFQVINFKEDGQRYLTMTLNEIERSDLMFFFDVWRYSHIPKEKDRGEFPLCNQGNIHLCGFSPWVVWISDLDIFVDFWGSKIPSKSPQNPLKNLRAMVSSQLSDWHHWNYASKVSSSNTRQFRIALMIEFSLKNLPQDILCIQVWCWVWWCRAVTVQCSLRLDLINNHHSKIPSKKGGLFVSFFPQNWGGFRLVGRSSHLVRENPPPDCGN